MVPDPDEIGIKPLTGDGDFRSGKSIELLKQADVVVTQLSDALLAVQPAEGRPLGLQPVAVAAGPQPSLSL
jgi:hypothetical protein